MAYNSTTQIITAPVDVGDVSNALGIDILDIGTLCDSDLINRWSFNKSIRSSNPGILSREDIMLARAGLSPVSIGKLLQSAIGNSSLPLYSKDECLSEIKEWGYLRPRGATYSEWFRLLDFNGYNHKAVAPDNGWKSINIDADSLTKMRAVSLEFTNTGVYAGTNYIVEPKYGGSYYYGGLYSDFSILLGFSAGQGINQDVNMEIPIEAVVYLDGNWRIALAIWIPNFGSAGGWGIFASRMTIGQFFLDNPTGSGTSLRSLFPDLATNPFGANLISSYISSQGGFATMEAVPLLIKDLQYTVASGLYQLRPTETSVAFSMPSGAKSISINVGTPPMTLYYKTSVELINGALAAFITNTDTKSHTFEYTVTNVTPNGSTTSSARTTNLAAGVKQQVGGAPMQAGYSVYITVLKQDGVSIV